MTQLGQAIRIATMAHDGQLRKGSRAPYIVHPIATMRILANIGVTDEDVLCAAVLHDVLEDTKLTRNELWQAGFSDRCIGIVEGMTKRPGETRAQYIESFAHATEEVRLIKIADRADNLSDTGWEVGPYYWAESRKLLDIIRDAPTARLHHELFQLDKILMRTISEAGH